MEPHLDGSEEGHPVVGNDDAGDFPPPMRRRPPKPQP